MLVRVIWGKEETQTDVQMSYIPRIGDRITIHNVDGTTLMVSAEVVCVSWVYNFEEDGGEEITIDLDGVSEFHQECQWTSNPKSRDVMRA